MRNKIVMILALFAVMTAMTGIASAYEPGIGPHLGYTCKEGNQNGYNYKECLKASWDNINLKIVASSANTVHTLNACYQVRYYPTGTYFENNLYSDESGQDNTGRVGPYPADSDGFYIGEIYSGNEDPHYESLNSVVSWIPGQWTVALMHKGVSAKKECDDIIGVANSFKVDVPVDITIPEFPTVALPIAVVIGMVFFFQNRKKKEE